MTNKKELVVEYRNIGDLIPYVNNSRTHSDEQVSQVAASIKEFGFTNPILIDADGGIIAGHGRVLAAKKLKLTEVPTITLTGLSEAQKKAYIIADNKLALNAGWDDELLAIEIEGLKWLNYDVELLGFDDDELSDLLPDMFEEDDDTYNNEDKDDRYKDGVKGSMAEKYGQPPFSILDTRKADWAERKRYWREKIGDNGESREGTLGRTDSIIGSFNNGVSLLDPVLAELMVAWFGLEGGVAFDPFAGDTVFGYVCGSNGVTFKGIELREEQAILNQERCNKDGLPCVYYNDTSENMDEYIEDESVDLIFSCPPYADLEVYSDDPRDLSNMDTSSFFEVYKRILQKTFSKLKDNRFAVIVMGEVRGKNGNYIGTIPKTIQIMEEAGYSYYNELILVNGAGTLPLRAGKVMQASRKIGKMHQNILVFLKGDSKQACKDLGHVSIKINEGEESVNDD